jgi:hypothetical protein
MFDQEERAEVERRRAREDLHDVLATEQGYRVWRRLLEWLGAGRMTASESEQVMKNVAEQLLDDMADAHPDAYLRFCGDIRRINDNHREENHE